MLTRPMITNTRWRLSLATAALLMSCTAASSTRLARLDGIDPSTRFDSASGTGAGGDSAASTPYAELFAVDARQTRDQTLTVGFDARDADGIREISVALLQNGVAVSDPIELAPSARSASVLLGYPLGDGYFVRLLVTDRLGYSTIVDSNDFSIGPDTTAPPAPQVAWQTPSVTNERSVGFRVENCEAQTSVCLAVDGMPPTISDLCVACSSEVRRLPLASDGSFLFVLVAKDAAGNVSGPSLPLQVRVDTTGPAEPVASFTPSGVEVGADSVSFTVTNCEAESAIAWTLDGAEPASWAPCSDSVTVPMPKDGRYTLRIYARDSLLNVSTPLVREVTRDRTAPVVVALSPAPGAFLRTQDTVLIDYVAADAALPDDGVVIEYSVGNGPFTVIDVTGGAGPVMWSTPAAGATNVTVRITATDLAGNSASVSVPVSLDGAPPVIATMRMNGLSTVAALPTVGESFVGVSLTVSDDGSGLMSVCLKRSVGPSPATAPADGDPCWQSIGALGGTPGAVNVTLPVVPYAFQTMARLPFRVFAWAKDRAGRSSVNAATLGVDAVRLAYDPGTAPVVTNVFAMNTNNAGWPLSPSETSGSPASTIYIKWKADFPNNAPSADGRIDLQYTVDDVLWTTFATEIANAPNGGCTLSAPDPNGSDPAANFTGCYAWTSPTGPTGYYNVRVVATDRKLLKSVWSATPPMNAGGVQFLVGNTDPGIGGSSLSTYFDAIESPYLAFRNGTFAVSSRGAVYYLDKTIGLFWVDPTTASSELLLRLNPSGASDQGDGGDVRLATAQDMQSIAIDGEGRIVVAGRNRLRRINVDAQNVPSTIETLIGGGTVGAPLGTGIPAASVELNCGVFGVCPVFALNNGDVWTSTNAGYSSAHYPSNPVGRDFRILRYHESQGVKLVDGFAPTGNGYLADVVKTDPIDHCYMQVAGAEFDPDTSTMQSFVLQLTASDAWSDSCWLRPQPSSYMFGYAVIGASGATLPAWTTRPHSTFDYYVPGTLQYTGRDGKLYWYNVYYGQQLFVHEPGYTDANNTDWRPILGTPSSDDACPDGTDRAACHLSAPSFFTTELGETFWFTAGKLRTLDPDGKAITIAGAGAHGGDGGPSLSARIGELRRFDTWRDGATTKFTLLDVGNRRIREAGLGGTMTTLTGNGSFSAEPLAPYAASGQPFYLQRNVSLAVDPPTGDVFVTSFTTANHGVLRYRRASGIMDWAIGCASGPCTPYWQATPGKLGAQIAFDDPGDNTDSYYTHEVLGIKGVSGDPDRHLLIRAGRYIPPTLVSDESMQYYRVTGSSGPTGVAFESNFVAKAGTGGVQFQNMAQRSDNYISYNTSGQGADAVYDEAGQRWIQQAAWYAADGRILGLPDASDGPITTLFDGTWIPIAAMALRRVPDGPNPDKEYLYYCYDISVYYPNDPKNHRLFVRNLSTSPATEVPLAWPISGLNCQGIRMQWDESRQSLIFIYSKGSLYGIAEYKDPPTPP